MKKRFNITVLPLIILCVSANVLADEKAGNVPTNAPTSVHSATQQPHQKNAEQIAHDKKIETAIANYKKIITKDPENKAAYRQLAGTYLLNNKAKKAIPAYQEAILHDPKNPKLFAAMSIAYLHLGKYAMAKAMANEAVALDPKMENAKKIISYADKKVEVLDQIAKATQGKMPIHDAAFLKKEKAKKEKLAHDE
ncbi:MAG: tetratricopeptide repeat protein [Cocleimonas sp.]|nr:tetratricopeptide repeat protein [Cocleimonas sp.]